jgi:hypothetical protein
MISRMIQRLREWRKRRRDATAEEIAGMSPADREASQAAARRAAKPSRHDGGYPTDL